MSAVTPFVGFSVGNLLSEAAKIIGTQPTCFAVRQRGKHTLSKGLGVGEHVTAPPWAEYLISATGCRFVSRNVTALSIGG